MTPPAQFYSFPRLKRKPDPADFESLLDLLPHAAFIIDTRSKRILYANSMAIELTTYTRSELSGMEFTAMYTDPGKEAIWEIAIGEAQLLPLTLTKRNKSVVDVLVSLGYLSVQQKWIIATIEPASHVQERESERKRRMASLESMRFIQLAQKQVELDLALEYVLQAAQHLFSTVGTAIYLQDINPQDRDIHIERRASIGKNKIFPETLPAQDLIHLRNPIIWYAGKRPSSSLHRSARANELIYVASAPLGQPTALIGIVAVAGGSLHNHDVLIPQLEILAEEITSLIERHTRLANLETEIATLIQLNSLHATIENAIDDAVVVLSPQLTILRMNNSAETMLGYTNSEALGQPVENILIGTETLGPLLKVALEGVPTLKVDNIHLYHRTGRAFLAEVSVLPAQQSGGSSQGAIILIQDLSEKEQIENKTKQLEQRALLGEVTAVFAHEVRNPINNISTGLQLMAYNLPASDPNQEVLARLEVDCDRISNMMKNVLAYSRNTEYEMEPVDLGMLVNRLLERSKPRMENQKVKLHLQIDSTIPQIQGNPRALEQVFTNLVANAIQAMEESGGTLTVKLQHIKASGERQYVEVDVADNGPGIPKENLERIFQPFFTTKPSGTGLGLAITKRIITAHKGNIQVSSFPGGTVFQVQLPAMEAM